jgi:surface carbohydrate biosynthesis protein
LALDFLILYEHIVREFENDCLIIAELKRRGYKAELFQLMDRKKIKYFTWKKPKVIVTSAMYNNETLNSFVYNNVGRLNKVVNLHWEEVISHRQEESDFYNLNENAARCTHICWGEAAKNRVVDKGVPENNAVITGAVQLDFLRPEFEGYFMPRRQLAEKYGLDVDKKWMCYISSFSCAFMDDKEVEELNRMTDLDFKGFKTASARSMEVTLGWFDRLLSEKEGIELIYRPHPNEWSSPLLAEMEEKYPSFRVIRDLSVKQWIKECDVLLTWMSTSIAEVYFAGKSCIVLRPEPVCDDYDPVIYRETDAADSYEKMLEYLERPEMPFPVDEAQMESHYHVDPCYPSYKRICDLLEWTRKNPPRDTPFAPGYKPRFNAVKFFVLIGLHILIALRINPHWFDFLSRSAMDQTERLMDYYRKARVSKKETRRKIEELKGYLS